MKNVTLLIVLAAIFALPAPPKPAKGNAQMITGGFAVSGDSKPEACKTACAGRATSLPRPALEG